MTTPKVRRPLKGYVGNNRRRKLLDVDLNVPPGEALEGRAGNAANPQLPPPPPQRGEQESGGSCGFPVLQEPAMIDVEAIDDEEKKKARRNNNVVVLEAPRVHPGNSDVLPVEDDLNEPTIGEKLASLELLEDDKVKTPEIEMTSLSTKPPSADSVHVLLKQALLADDRALLLDCLHTQDEKHIGFSQVIANSISLLTPSDVLKLLDFLISIVQSRGAVLVCALPWLKSLLLQHASAIMSQDSSIRALNSLYQIIESRVSTFQSALQLSSVLDYLFVGIYDDMADESNTFSPTIYEDKDESDEDEPDDATETDNESDEPPPINGFSDLDVSDGMSE
ncbi:hypothetical protein IFM89_017596 [Coptis chinensis]|uniref:Small-subunit processome Utp12 domain-containing protein n=1 Tax=Coptis chinensis TaxID=261450 RepID=A0A835GZC6_9MAGN|nr:hypothetical protein IFM89_017596 [Coptis chinensis]